MYKLEDLLYKIINKRVSRKQRHFTIINIFLEKYNTNRRETLTPTSPEPVEHQAGSAVMRGTLPLWQ